MNYAYRNDRASALQWLGRSYRERELKLGIEIVGESLFRNLWGEPEYKNLLRTLKLPN